MTLSKRDERQEERRRQKPDDIFEAVERNDRVAVERFVEKEGVSVAGVNYRLQTPAHLAAANGNLDILRYVVEKNSSVLAMNDLYGRNILFVAIDNDFEEAVKYLVENRHVTDLHRRFESYSGNTAIHRAAQLGRLAILKYLIEERKAKVDVRNDFGQPPLFLAAENEQFRVVKYLVEEQNADLKTTDENQFTILHIAVNNDDLALMKYVLDERKADLDVNKRGKFGITLAQRAADLNRLKLLVYLVDEKRANIETTNDWGESPLHSAARENHYEVCKFLLERGANTRTKDNRGHSPIEDTTDDRILKCILDATPSKRSRRSPTAAAAGEESSPPPPPSLPYSTLMTRSSGNVRTRIRSHGFNATVSHSNSSDGGGLRPFVFSVDSTTADRTNFSQFRNFLTAARIILIYVGGLRFLTLLSPRGGGVNLLNRIGHVAREKIDAFQSP